MNAIDEAIRSMPVDATAERAVISCLLLDPAQMIDKATEIGINSNSFYLPAHKITFNAIREVGYEADILLLSSFLTDKGQIDQIGGQSALAAFLDDLPTTSLFSHYAEIVKQKQILRSIIQKGSEMVSKCYENTDAKSVLEWAESAVMGLSDSFLGKVDSRTKTWKEIAQDFINEVEESSKEPSGLTTGMPELDDLCGNLQKGDQIVLSAKSSHGKTALAMNIVEHNAINGKRIVVFSAEMNSTQLYGRVIAGISQVGMKKIRQPSMMGKIDLQKVTNSMAQSSDWKIHIDDTPNMNIGMVTGVCRRVEKEHGKIDLVVFDYLQLAQPANPKDPRERQIADMSNRLKVLARDMEVPVIVLAQVNKDKGLRESEAAEQNADLIWYVEQDADQMEEGKTTRDAKFIQKKGRNSGTGTLKMKYVTPLLRFKIADENEVKQGSEF